MASAGAAIAASVLLLACGSPRTGGSPFPAPSGPPLEIASKTLPAGEVGLRYSVTVEAKGGVQPYMFQNIEGSLPAGLSLSRDGAIAGTPTAAGDFSFSIQVVDSGGQAISAQDSIDIVPALSLQASHAGTIYVESGCDGVCGGFATQAGGLAPYKYAVTSGGLPAGTSLSGTSLAGKFTSTGNYSFTVQVTDALGATASAGASFSVISHIYFYCPTPWPGGRGGCIPAGGSGAYNGALTFGCTQVASHPDCTGQMMFAGGSSGGWTVTYRVVAGMQPPAGSYIGPPVAGTTPPQTALSLAMVAPPTSGATAYGTLLVTLSDNMVCGSGGARCSTSAYLTWSVQNRNP